MYSFKSAFFAQHCDYLFMLFRVTVLSSFSWPYSTPFCNCCTIYLLYYEQYSYEHSGMCLLIKKINLFPLGLYLGIELLDWRVCKNSVLIDVVQQFSKVCVPLTLPPAMHENSSGPQPASVVFFYFSHSGVCISYGFSFL